MSKLLLYLLISVLIGTVVAAWFNNTSLGAATGGGLALASYAYLKNKSH